MKKTNQIRLDNYDVCAIYELLSKKREEFIDHYMEDGSPVYVYTKKNQIYLSLYYKFQREITVREIFNA